MGNWHILWYGIVILIAIGVISLFFKDYIDRAIKKVQHYASGHVTEHHRYEPFD